MVCQYNYNDLDLFKRIIDIILLYVDQLLIIKINENDNIKFSNVDT